MFSTFTQTVRGVVARLVGDGLALAPVDRSEGQTLVEYALILSLISVAVATVLYFLGGDITSIFVNVSSSL